MNDSDDKKLLQMLRGYILKLELEIDCKYPEEIRIAYPRSNRLYLLEMEPIWRDKEYLSSLTEGED